MKNSLEKRKYLIMLTAMSLICGIAGAFVLKSISLLCYFDAYPFIPIYFFVFGVVYIYMSERVRQNVRQKTLMWYVAIRMMKLMISVVTLIFYGVLFETHVKEFMLTFIVFYLIYLIFEISFFYNFERNEEIIEKGENKE